ncbi:hypothetical protein AB1Y20_003746 [Prymnesium parvum]|uniref:Terpene cyclase/mutase family member n=1 Tax=Prymnesium parvum TaxID=97485 RepID=A0AB34J7H5_PRYPA
MEEISLPAALAAAAIVGCASVLIFGHALANTPLHAAGTNRGAGFNTRVLGYDTARGEFSLLATTCIFAPPILCICSALSFHGRMVCGALVGLFLCWYASTPSLVSHPGGPRAHRILRQPQWPDKEWRLDRGWHCAVAEESHRLTEAEADTSAGSLTGEPAGRQTWHKRVINGQVTEAFNPSANPNPNDSIWRAQRIAEWKAKGGSVPDASWQPKEPMEYLVKAMSWYQVLQADDGHWAGDYGGPHFLLPGLIIVWYVSGASNAFLSPEQRKAMLFYLRAHQQLDGGWGMHIESPSTMFGSCMCYMAIRLLGASAEDPSAAKGREFILSHGGGLYTGSWAKFYMCLLGVMDWRGHHVIPAEMWLLPGWFPFHPSRMWCHCRMVYLPMSYLYGNRFVYSRADIDPLIAQLRQELYPIPYEDILWKGTASLVADIDNYSPLHPVMKVANALLHVWEDWGGPLRRALRAKGLHFALEYMHAEDEQTNYVCIGPVNKVLNMLSTWHAAGGQADSPSFKKHILRVSDYLWVSEDGMKMQGYNGSQGWDASFTMQALAEAGLVDEFQTMCCRAYAYLERTQILSTAISQERLKAVLLLRNEPCIRAHCSEISDARLYKALNVLLTLQNVDGGWATYENNRGYSWYEWLNPSEVFGDIMIDYSYVECSMASLSAVYMFHLHYPNHRVDEVQRSIVAGRRFIKTVQRTDGSWYGSWGCCFTYGTWFGVEGLVLSGEPPNSESLRRACSFLLAKQNANGGWGEDFTSCYDKAYAKDGMARYGNGGSGVVNTAWALLALMAAGCANVDAVRRGINFLISQQLPNGDWTQEGIAGVFNRACGISYTQYRNIFPMWAIARYARHYGPKMGLLPDKQGMKS